jgi:hypothetical protein
MAQTYIKKLFCDKERCFWNIQSPHWLPGSSASSAAARHHSLPNKILPVTRNLIHHLRQMSAEAETEWLTLLRQAEFGLAPTLAGLKLDPTTTDHYRN